MQGIIARMLKMLVNLESAMECMPYYFSKEGYKLLRVLDTWKLFCDQFEAASRSSNDNYDS